jgi:hypothetical protein
MRRVFMTMLAAAFGCGGAGLAAQPALAADLCVGGPQPGCFLTIQAAVDAAHDGDTIRIGAGTFAGGIEIAKSVQLLGAGASSTIIRGGGPVVMIGDLSGRAAPTVSIGGVTITGGLTTGSGGETWVAEGGGVVIPGPDTGNATAATVSISDSVITGNRASPLTVILPSDPPGPPCGSRVCSFASGGGIANAGFLTLTDTRVTDNVAGSTTTDPSAATDAGGGGISNHPRGTLTLRHSVVSGNRAAVSGALAQYASGGGVFGGVVTIEDSEISRNTVDLSSSFPGSFSTGDAAEAESGGIEVGDTGSATIASSTISENSVTGFNSGGDLLVRTAGIDADGPLVLNNSHVDDNRVRGRVPPDSGFVVVAFGGGLALGGAPEPTSDTVTVNNSTVNGNDVHVESAAGLASMLGAGIFDDATMTLHHTSVVGNSGHATGAFGFAQGGGIWGGVFLGIPADLTVVGGLIAGNTVTAGPGITPLGGGLFSADLFTLTPFPATLVHTQITGNQPDECFGC